MVVIRVKGKQFYNIISQESPEYKYVFVDFYTKWCGPCKAISPKIESLSVKYPNIIFTKIDIDKNSNTKISDNYDINSIPTFMIFEIGNFEPIHPRIIGAKLNKIKIMLHTITSKKL